MDFKGSYKNKISYKFRDTLKKYNESMKATIKRKAYPHPAAH